VVKKLIDISNCCHRNSLPRRTYSIDCFFSYVTKSNTNHEGLLKYQRELAISIGNMVFRLNSRTYHLQYRSYLFLGFRQIPTFIISMGFNSKLRENDGDGGVRLCESGGVRERDR